MNRTEKPQVFMIGQTVLIPEGVTRFLDAVGVQTPGTMTENLMKGSQGEALIELAGRSCYKSYEVGLNPNIKKIRSDRKKYIGNILKSGHGSVLEHSTVTFAFVNVSRVFTHEIVRHRAGTAFSQESLRFVRMEEIPFWIPPSLSDGGVPDHIESTIKSIERDYAVLVKHFGIEEMTSFTDKKAITSALRRILPIGLSTCIIVTANHRAWRHIIEQRCSGHGEEEIQLVISAVAAYLITSFPVLYQDMKFESDGVWTFEHSKI